MIGRSNRAASSVGVGLGLYSLVFDTQSPAHRLRATVESFNRPITIKDSIMSSIDFISARQILDSRGNPTLEADVILDDGNMGPGGGSQRGQHGRA